MDKLEAAFELMNQRVATRNTAASLKRLRKAMQALSIPENEWKTIEMHLEYRGSNGKFFNSDHEKVK